MLQLSIGVILSLFGSLLGSLGVVFQKKSATMYRCKEISLIKQPWWIWGILLIVCGASVEFAALFFAPLVVVGTLLITRLVWITIFANIMLHEEVNKVHILAILLILVGCNLIILSYYITSDTHSVNINILTDVVYWIYVSIFIISAIFLTRITYINQHVKYALATGIMNGVLQIKRKVVSNQFRDFNYHDTDWWGVIIISFIVVGIVGMLMCSYSSLALKNTSTIFTSSITDTVIILMNILTAGILFKELLSYDAINWILTFSGVMSIISGIRIMLSQEHDPQPCPPDINLSITL